MGLAVVVLMWFIWNKTTFGKNMFAVGSNPEAANVSGVNVMRTTILVHMLAGMMYGITGFIESARIGSNTACLLYTSRHLFFRSGIYHHGVS